MTIILSQEEEMRHALDELSKKTSDMEFKDKPSPNHTSNKGSISPRQQANRKTRRAMAKKSRKRNRRKK